MPTTETSLAPANSRASAAPVAPGAMVCGWPDNRSDRFPCRSASPAEKRGLHLGVGVGQQRRGQIFVGEAEPGIGGVPALGLLVVHLLVGLGLLALVAHHADQAFVQDVIAEHRRRAVARDQRIGKQRHRAAALVRDLVLDGEEIMVVDRDGAGEEQALRRCRRSASPDDRRRARPSLAASTPYRGRASRPWCRRPAPSRIRRNRRPARPTARTARSAANSDRWSRGIASASDRRCGRL